MILALYVDHMLIAEALGEVKLICDKLKSTFVMVDLGTVSNFLALVVSMDTSGHTISLTQEGYIYGVLEKFGMASCKPVGTPMEKDKPGMKGGRDKLCDRTLYWPLIGKVVAKLRSVHVLILLFRFLTLEGSTRALIIVTGFLRNGSSDILEARRRSDSVLREKCEQVHV